MKCLNIHHHLHVYKYTFSFILSMVETASKIRLELTIDKMSSIVLKRSPNGDVSWT